MRQPYSGTVAILRNEFDGGLLEGSNECLPGLGAPSNRIIGIGRFEPANLLL